MELSTISHSFSPLPLSNAASKMENIKSVYCTFKAA